MHFMTRMYSPPLYITTCHARDGVSDTPEHSNHIYLPNSSLIGDTDTVAWLRATRCTGTRPHRASQAPIVCTASLHATPPFQATKSKALLVLSGRGAAVALVWRSAKTSVHFVLARLMRRRSGQNGRTRKDRARATMSLDFSGARHVGRNRYQE